MRKPRLKRKAEKKNRQKDRKKTERKKRGQKHHISVTHPPPPTTTQPAHTQSHNRLPSTTNTVHLARKAQQSSQRLLVWNEGTGWIAESFISYMAWLFSTWYGIDRRIYHLLHGVVVFNIYAVFFKGKRRFWPKGRRRVVINTFGGGESCWLLRSCEPPTRIQLSLMYDLWGMTSGASWDSITSHMTRHYNMRNNPVFRSTCETHVDVFCPIKISVLIFRLIFHRSVVV